MRRLAALASAIAIAIAVIAFASSAFASTSYDVDYHGAYVAWVWDGNGTYLDYMAFSIRDITDSNICPTYGVEGNGYMWRARTCTSPGRSTGYRWNWDAGVRAGTYTEFVSMPGWPTLYHNFTVS